MFIDKAYSEMADHVRYLHDLASQGEDQSGFYTKILKRRLEMTVEKETLILHKDPKLDTPIIEYITLEQFFDVFYPLYQLERDVTPPGSLTAETVQLFAKFLSKAKGAGADNDEAAIKTVMEGFDLDVDMDTLFKTFIMPLWSLRKTQTSLYWSKYHSDSDFDSDYESEFDSDDEGETTSEGGSEDESEDLPPDLA